MSGFTLDLNERLINQKEELSREAQHMVLFECANKFSQLASDIVSREATDTGNLAQGIATGLHPKVPGAKEYTVRDQTNYGVYVNDGTRPHMPPVDALKDWARRTLGDESAAWPVAMSIKKRGTKPVKFWERAFIEVDEIWVDTFMQKHTAAL